MFGAAAIMGTFVACGRVDAYFEDEIMICSDKIGILLSSK